MKTLHPLYPSRALRWAKWLELAIATFLLTAAVCTTARAQGTNNNTSVSVVVLSNSATTGAFGCGTQTSGPCASIRNSGYFPNIGQGAHYLTICGGPGAQGFMQASSDDVTWFDITPVYTVLANQSCATISASGYYTFVRGYILTNPATVTATYSAIGGTAPYPPASLSGQAATIPICNTLEQNSATTVNSTTPVTIAFPFTATFLQQIYLCGGNVSWTGTPTAGTITIFVNVNNNCGSGTNWPLTSFGLSTTMPTILPINIGNVAVTTQPVIGTTTSYLCATVTGGPATYTFNLNVAFF